MGPVCNTRRKNRTKKLKKSVNYHPKHRFCSDENLDSENILNAIPIELCCYDSDALLISDNQIDLQYTNQVKDFFRALASLT